MTFEKKCFISPADILAVRLRCSKCGAITTIPLEKLSNASFQAVITKNCLHCDAASNFPYGTTEFANFVQFNVFLAGLKNSLVGRNLEYGFEIDCAAEKS